MISLLAAQDAHINSLTELLRIYRYRQFGNKLEKTSSEQVSLFDEADLPKNTAATIFSLVETCKYHGIEPYDWFRYVLSQLPLCKSSDEIVSLLPFNIDKKLLMR